MNAKGQDHNFFQIKNNYVAREELRKACIGYFRPADVKTSLKVLDMYSDFFEDAVRTYQPDQVNSQRDAEAKIVLQMMWTKVMHIKEVLSGVNLEKNGTEQSKIIDPTVVAILTRNVYETVGMFNVVYRAPSTVDERLILYNLWVHSGLSYRQKFVEVVKTEENRKKAEDEKTYMRRLVTEIEGTQLFKSLDEKNQCKIKARLKEKEYLMRFDKTNVTFLNWNDIPKIMNIESLLDKIYGYFSMYAHPSNVSVFQFADMFRLDKEEYLELINFNLRILLVMVSSFIADYIAVYPNVLGTFNNQPVVNQIVINFHQKFIRGNDYTINNASDALN